MKRRVRSAKENLDWTVRLVWIPTAIRPIGPKQLHDVGTTTMMTSGEEVMPLSLLLSAIAFIPVMLVVLPLRYARVLPWTIEAVTYPWGKGGGPAEVQRWRVRGGRRDLRRVTDEIAAALECGETRPTVAGAVRG